MKTNLWLISGFLAFFGVSLPAASTGFREFITCKDGRLLEGKLPFRFLSFNIPNLTYTEDDMQFTHLSNFRLPTAYELDDALATIQQMGGRVARTYVLSVRKPGDPPDLPRHILGPDKLDEEAMSRLDQALEIANRHQVRLIIPFIDENSWWGGIEEFAGFRNKTRKEFFTAPEVREDYKGIVRLVLNRVNTRTGVRYRDDKAVLAWELGNELVAPKEWVAEMATYIKEIDPNHLVAESYFTAQDNAGVDIVQDHLYQGDPVKMIAQIRASYERAAGHRAYMVGEFGFVGTDAMRSIMDTIVREPGIAGGLIWSLRFHNQDGGYYWHHEPFGGDFFKAYHWPGGPGGEAYDEARFMRIARAKAYEIQGMPVPHLLPPIPPDLFSVTDGGLLNWRGSTGAMGYDVQRSEVAGGNWHNIAYQLPDDAVQYHPLAADEFCQPGKSYYYRVVARDEAGSSKPSKAVGPTLIRCRTLVDEFSNWSRIYRKGGSLDLKSNDARNYKEDCHRLLGSTNSWIAYQVTGQIVAARVYAFGEPGEPDLQFHAGCEPGQREMLNPQAEDFFSGKDMYNFKPPRRYSLGKFPDRTSAIVIQFRNQAQIGRVEIEYR